MFNEHLQQPPFIIRDPLAPQGFSGYCIDLIDKMAEMDGFDYIIEEVPDQKFGRYLEDKGVWTGIVNELLEKRADIGLGSISVMAERENVIDFTIPFYDLVGIGILVNIPRAPSDFFRFATVMHGDVWLCILIAHIVTRLKNSSTLLII